MYWDKPKKIRRTGFTFIEVMIVVVIIGVLAGVVTLSTRHYLDKAKINRAKSDISSLVGALESYYGENGRYPTNEEGLNCLASMFVSKVNLDPWGHPYQYNQPGRKGPFEVICFGADGREGGDGVNSDISSDDLQQEAKSP